MKNSVIALITDFGEDDFFVGSLKAVITSINPSARMIDITHNIPSFDVLSGSFALQATFTYFPAQTVFLAIIDPGVGSKRRILLAETEKYYFIAPDNGVLSLALESQRILNLREIASPQFFLPRTSRTFEGRDKMAPAAAWLSKGIPVEKFGPEVSSYARLKVEKPAVKKGEIVGTILYQDKFGNLITNIPAVDVERLRRERSQNRVSLIVGGCQISSSQRSYSSARKGELMFLEGSLGLIEIAAREQSAAEIIPARQGDRVVLSSGQKKNGTHRRND